MVQDSSTTYRSLYWTSGVWICIASLLVGLRMALPAQTIESLYSREFFPLIRDLLDGFFGWWPIPASAVVLVAGIFLLLKSVRRSVKGGTSAYAKTAFGVLALLRGIAIIVIAFMVLWGMNYGRVDLAQHLGLDTRELTTEELWEELRQTSKFVSILRTQLPLSDESNYESLPLSQATESRIRYSLKKQLKALDLPYEGSVRIREVVGGGLLRFNTSGIYFPLTGEGHIDAGLHSLQVPFVMAHEMSHGFGITDEGDCNFLAWLACTRDDNLYVRYSGHLTYLRYIGSAVRKRDPTAYLAFRQNLPKAVLADLNSIAENLDRYEEILPEVRDVVYDNYLKSQGVADGMASYSRVIGLVAAWRSGRRRPLAMQTAVDPLLE